MGQVVSTIAMVNCFPASRGRRSNSPKCSPGGATCAGLPIVRKVRSVEWLFAMNAPAVRAPMNRMTLSVLSPDTQHNLIMNTPHKGSAGNIRATTPIRSARLDLATMTSVWNSLANSPTCFPIRAHTHRARATAIGDVERRWMSIAGRDMSATSTLTPWVRARSTRGPCSVKTTRISSSGMLVTKRRSESSAPAGCAECVRKRIRIRTAPGGRGRRAAPPLPSRRTSLRAHGTAQP